MSAETIAATTEKPDVLMLCFLHDHLREIMALQATVIEAALLGDEFVSKHTVDRLRDTASVYLGYADQIEGRIDTPCAIDFVRRG